MTRLPLLFLVGTMGCIDWDSLSPDLQARCADSDGLVGYWPFDEGTGLVANDLSSSHQAVALYGNAMWVPGALGGALQFGGGSTDRAILQSTAGLDFDHGTGSFATSYWIAPQTFPAGDIRPFELACAGQGAIFAEVTTAGGIGLTVYDATGASAVTFSPDGALEVGRWTHVAQVWDRGSGQAVTYIDGSERSRTPVALTGAIDCSTSATSSFGGWSGAFSYTGAIDDVRIFDRVLTATEVMELAQLMTTGCPW